MEVPHPTQGMKRLVQVAFLRLEIGNGSNPDLMLSASLCVFSLVYEAHVLTCLVLKFAAECWHVCSVEERDLQELKDRAKVVKIAFGLQTCEHNRESDYRVLVRHYLFLSLGRDLAHCFPKLPFSSGAS